MIGADLLAAVVAFQLPHAPPDRKAPTPYDLESLLNSDYASPDRIDEALMQLRKEGMVEHDDAEWFDRRWTPTLEGVFQVIRR